MGCTGSAPEAAKAKGLTPKDDRFWDDLALKVPCGTDAASKAKRDRLFADIDVDGNGELTLQEVTKGIKNQLRCDALYNCKPAINRAYNYAKATDKRNGARDSRVDRSEFRILLVKLNVLFRLHTLFSEADRNADRHLSRLEIELFFAKINKWGAGIADFDKAFRQIDADAGGDVTFREVADWAMMKDFPALGLGDHNALE